MSRSLFLLLQLAAHRTACACEVRPWVDYHFDRPALDVALVPTFGWQLSPECTGAQEAYALRISYSSRVAGALWESELVRSNVSDGIAAAPTLESATE
jgi:hypothetical protein